MPSRVSWAIAGGTTALVAFLALRRVWQSHEEEPRAAQHRELRNAGFVYRPVGASGEPYPEWVRALDGKSGVYVIREIQRDGSEETVYVGESHTGRLYDTLTRHLQS
jgi:hypothetical protein